MECIEWKPAIDSKTGNIKPEHFNLKINGVDCGEWDYPRMRHLIEVTDNTIENYLP